MMRSEMLSWPVTLAILVVAFGSLVAAGLPLMLTMGIAPLVAAGTNLGISILVSVAGAWPHYKAKRVVTRVVIVFGLPAILDATCSIASSRRFWNASSRSFVTGRKSANSSPCPSAGVGNWPQAA